MSASSASPAGAGFWWARDDLGFRDGRLHLETY
jgi:hypothetical protein